MKSLTNVLRRSELNPLERVTALVHNNIQREKTGKSILSESDIKILAEKWIPKNTYEVKKYNKYISIAKLEGFMSVDAQMFFYKSENSLLRSQRILDQACFGEIDEIALTADYVTEVDSMQMMIRGSYLEYLKVLHILTFHNLKGEVQDDLILLDEYISSDKKYFEDEVFLYELLNDEKIVSDYNKTILVDKICSQFFCERHNSKKEKDRFVSYGFFAGLPAMSIVYKWAEYNSILYDESDSNHKKILIEKIKDSMEKRGISMKHAIREVLSQWIDDGLFMTEYVPLFKSDGYKTWNGTTNKNHKELFMLWYAELQKTKKYLTNLFNKKHLVKKKNDKKIEIITGESLYKCTKHISFVQEYKEQIEFSLPLSNMFLFIENYSKPIDIYRSLVEFSELVVEISNIFNIDMGEKYIRLVDEYDQGVIIINIGLSMLIDNVKENLYKQGTLKYLMEISKKDFLIDLSVGGSVVDIVNEYKKRFKKI